MSLLSEYLLSLRVRRNLTDLALAKKAGLELELYRQIEERPENVPLELLYKVFEGLQITPAESEEFNHIAHCTLQKPPDPDTSNVLPFKSRRGLNSGRSKKKLTRKDLGENT